MMECKINSRLLDDTIRVLADLQEAAQGLKAERDKLRDIALFLWDIIDDIDTATDQAKDNDAAYRSMVEKLQKKRWAVGSSDWHKITFKVTFKTGADGRKSTRIVQGYEDGG